MNISRFGGRLRRIGVLLTMTMWLKQETPTIAVLTVTKFMHKRGKKNPLWECDLRLLQLSALLSKEIKIPRSAPVTGLLIKSSYLLTDVYFMLSGSSRHHGQQKKKINVQDRTILFMRGGLIRLSGSSRHGQYSKKINVQSRTILFYEGWFN